jgi:osmotically-inducible protein OsmY
MKTDTQLQQDVMAELRWEPAVHAAQIGVAVRDGVVTLAGEVSSYAEKWNAERATQRVAGVLALAVELEVKLGELGRRSDADIAQSAKNVLSWTSSLPADAVQVLVEGGSLTLSGDVPWQYQRQDAAEAVRQLPGVVGVSNQILIKPTPAVGIVKADIEAALARRALTEAHSIAVEVRGSDVTLSGSVNSWAERDLATRTAWAAAGVGNVVDKLTLAY